MKRIFVVFGFTLLLLCCKAKLQLNAATLSNGADKTDATDNAEEIIDSPPAVRVKQEVSISWRKVDGATSYTLVVAKDAACSESVTKATDIKQEAFALTFDQPGTFYLCVTALDQKGSVLAEFKASKSIVVETEPLTKPLDPTVPVSGNAGEATKSAISVTNFKINDADLYTRDSTVTLSWNAPKASTASLFASADCSGTPTEVPTASGIHAGWTLGNVGRYNFVSAIFHGANEADSPCVTSSVQSIASRTNERISAGGVSACALSKASEVWCWGAYNMAGELGNGTTGYVSSPATPPVPAPVLGVSGTGRLGNVKQISTGFDLAWWDDHTCAVLGDGRVACWGLNRSGQIGAGTISSGSDYGISTPTIVKGIGGMGELTGVVSVVSGGLFTCAVMNDTRLACWGLKAAIGTGAASDTPYPMYVKAFSGGPDLTGVVQVAAGQQRACAVMNDGRLTCWGGYIVPDGSSQTSAAYPTYIGGISGVGQLSGVTAVGVSYYFHVCALHDNSQVSCWGNSNYLGHLGDGTYSNHFWPEWVKDPTGTGLLTGIKALYVNGDDGNNGPTCGLNASGNLYCWGTNLTGHVWDFVSLPEVMAGVNGVGTLDGVVDVAVGSFYNDCALLSDGRLTCWGDNDQATIGDGTWDVRQNPVVIQGWP